MNMLLSKRRCSYCILFIASIFVVFAPDQWLWSSLEHEEQHGHITYGRWLSCFETPRLLVPKVSKNKNNNNTIDSNININSNTDKCPAVIRQQQGLYSNNTSNGNNNTYDERFRNVVLLTAANQKFTRLLTNWEIIAREKGLKWVLLAFDEEMYNSRGGDNGNNNGAAGTSLLISHDKQMAHAGKYRTQSYNKLVCNKIRMVKDILDDCGNVEIVFSDVDNVLLQDPFQHHLGNMIRSRRYDYIYQTNDAWTERPGRHSCISEGKPVEMGNTGFHYLRPTQRMKEVLQATLERCDHPENELDDQTIFWEILYGSFQNKTWQHCPANADITDKQRTTSLNHADSTDKQTTTGNSDDSVGRFCCLDPHFFASGRIQPTRSDDLVTLHANFVSHVKAKERKLRDWTTHKDGWRLATPAMDRMDAAAAAASTPLPLLQY